MLEEGQPAPDFTLSTDSGNEISLTALRGKPVVLYPKDDASLRNCSIRRR